MVNTSHKTQCLVYHGVFPQMQILVTDWLQVIFWLFFDCPQYKLAFTEIKIVFIFMEKLSLTSSVDLYLCYILSHLQSS